MALYGGFVGTETLRDQRDPTAHLTILSGDIDGDDSQNPITDLTTVDGNTTNSYHVVTGATGAILDGFTITAGYSDGDAYPNYWGGGMYNNNSSPTLTNVIFSGNKATTYGGGMYNGYSNPTLTDVTFSGNTATTYGGGMYNDYSNPTLTDVTFSGNTATTSGGGMFNSSRSPTLTTEKVVIGDIILAEVLQGFRSDQDFETARQALLRFSQVSILNPDLAVRCARSYRQLRKVGITVRKTVDCFIATYCIENNIELLHCDRDFDPFEQLLGLQVIHPSP